MNSHAYDRNRKQHIVVFRWVRVCFCITSACAYTLRLHDKTYVRHNEVVVVSSYNLVDVVAVSSYNLVDVVIRIELLRSS